MSVQPAVHSCAHLSLPLPCLHPCTCHHLPSAPAGSSTFTPAPRVTLCNLAHMAVLAQVLNGSLPGGGGPAEAASSSGSSGRKSGFTGTAQAVFSRVTATATATATAMIMAKHSQGEPEARLMASFPGPLGQSSSRDKVRGRRTCMPVWV